MKKFLVSTALAVISASSFAQGVIIQMPNQPQQQPFRDNYEQERGHGNGHGHGNGQGNGKFKHGGPSENASPRAHEAYARNHGEYRQEEYREYRPMPQQIPQQPGGIVLDGRIIIK